MKKQLTLLLCLTMIFSSITFVSHGEQLKEITFVLDWTPNTNHTGLYVAIDQGYFKEAGLDVKVVQPPEGGAEMLVGTGKANFGVSFQDSMLPAILGDHAIPITAVSAIIAHNTSGIVSRAGEGMTSPKGLEGKKYATWDMPVEKAMMKNVMEKDGADFEKLSLIPSTVTDEVSALKSNSVDAIWIFYAWAGVACEVAGLPIDYFSFADINPAFDYYTPVIIANNDYLAKNADEARAFLSALSKGYQFAVENPTEAGNILIKHNPELEDAKELVLASQEYLADEYISDSAYWGEIDPVRWNTFYAWLSENGLSSEPVPENLGFSNDYLTK